MNTPRLLTIAVLAALTLAACGKSEPDAPAADAMPATDAAASTDTAMPTAVRYKVEFTTTWTKANFPFEYPDGSLIHKPHFSGWIGTGHNDGYTLFKEGAMPSPGLEALSETGKHQPLDGEIRAAIAAGSALGVAESDPLKDFAGKASFEVSVDDAHPRASAVAMIAPSPDWFAGVDVDLRENGAFVASKTVDVMAWDSGGDDGATYFADDADNDPKKPTAPSSARQFMKDGKAQPIGTLTFTRL